MQSPELEGIINDMKEKVQEIQEKIVPLLQLIKSIPKNAGANDEVVQYLEVKHQLLLTYCLNVVFYLYMKVRTCNILV